MTVRPDAVVALNRAVAVGELRGPEAGLAALESLTSLVAERLAEYQPFHAARADLLVRAGRFDDALASYDRALELTDNLVERSFLEAQRQRAAGRPPRAVIVLESHREDESRADPLVPTRGRSPAHHIGRAGCSIRSGDHGRSRSDANPVPLEFGGVVAAVQFTPLSDDAQPARKPTATQFSSPSVATP